MTPLQTLRHHVTGAIERGEGVAIAGIPERATPAHSPPQQAPDTKPGAYYVTVTDGPRCGRLLGPFINDHAGALALVDAARAKAETLDPRAIWYAYGTARFPDDDIAPLRFGVLNGHFGLPTRRN